MKKGLFMVLEGGEGSGKSSAVEWLKEQLSPEEFLFTREPGGVENAEEIREVVLKKRESPLDTLTHLLLFEAARREHMTKKILPTLAKGTHVICDRFSASTYGYQIVAGEGGAYEALFKTIDDTVREGHHPDLTIFLDLDPAVGIARKVGSNEELNAFDEQELVFHEKVRTGIRSYIKDINHRVVDASKTREEVRSEIKSIIVEYCKHYA